MVIVYLGNDYSKSVHDHAGISSHAGQGKTSSERCYENNERKASSPSTSLVPGARLRFTGLADLGIVEGA